MEETRITEEMRIAAGESYREREYWLDQLAGELQISRFPVDYYPLSASAEMEVSRKDSLDFSISEEILPRMLKLSNNSDDRLFMILLASLDSLLYKYSGSKDIIVGTTIKKQEIEEEFINTVLPLRNILRGNMSFKELLLLVRTTFYDALENQNYPLPVLLDDLHLTVRENQPVLFDTAILLTDIQDKKYFRDTYFNMFFSFSKEEDSISGSLEYDSRLYEKETITRIICHFINLLKKVLFKLDIEIDDIDILSETERKQLLFEFNAANAPLNDLVDSGEPRIHQVFAAQVEKNPDNTAIIFEDNILTYNRLKRQSNLLAHHLRSRGVKPGSLVALFFNRSLRMIEGIFAVLKAGGAYLPIDPLYPTERIKYILAESGVEWVVTNCREIIDRDVLSGIEIIDSGIAAGYDADQRLANLPNVNRAADIIYAIYTSGSTGRPKGVILEHKAVEEMLYWRIQEYNFTKEDCALQVFSYAFDGFVTSFFTPVLSGARIVLVSDKEILDLPKLASLVAKYRVTHFISVPQLYREIITNLTREESLTLKVVTLAGDQLDSGLIELSNKKNGDIEIAHEYGVTEAAVMSTILRNQERCSRVSIGKPVGNTTVYILSEQKKLQPIGVHGELCIGGTGLARGYLNKPALTAEKFVSAECLDQGAKQELLSKTPCYYAQHGAAVPHHSALLYKTGDRVRWSGDGTIEFLGRIDSQVKIRGFRIEIAEIENRLREHDGINDAAVIARGDNPADKYLCAFIVAKEKNKIDTSEIIEYLSKTLPLYMIPTHFMEIDRIPLTPHGKIDRRSLVKHESNNKRDTEYIAPRTESEARLAEIWLKELEVDIVGIKDNYFNIGGDSIKVIRLVNKINKSLKQNLEIVDLYQNSTIEELALLIEKNRIIESTNEENSEVLREIEELKNLYLERLSDNGN